ncbi:MAG TPA: protein kinase [Thermoanaerobaculia bacterium]|nr:protein kinase [Thermoanaerobaculia bacterium]
MSLAPGSYIGDYEIVAPLGAGGMGEVYRARDRRLGRDVAVKVLSGAGEGVAEPHAEARFEREARSAAALSHPNILAVHHFGREGEVQFLVTELLEGETLRRRISRGSLRWKEAVQVGIEIAEGLAAAHARGIIHRDLKPENVFLTRDGQVKILDFGLARLELPAAADSGSTALKTAPGTVMGTLAYMSPEQLRGETAEPASDLFALGCILHEMVSGTPLFARGTASEIISAVLRDEAPELIETNPEVPAELSAIVGRCLTKEKEQRFQSARDLAFDLRRLLGVRHSRRWASWPLAAAVALVLLAGYLIARRTGPEVASASRDQGRAPRAPKALTQLTFTKGVEQFPSWSPDATQIVYSREEGKLRRLYLKSLTEGTEKPLTSGEADEIQPAWSPDGKTIVFVRASAAGSRLEPADVFAEYISGGDIWAIDLESGEERRLLSRAFNPAWSADGTRIAFDASWGGPRRIWIADRLGHNPQQATTDTSEAVAHVRPRWSPDGRRIVFQNIDRTQFDIRVVDLATKEMEWLTNDAIRDLNPVWAPSGAFVYFSSYRGGGINVWRFRVLPDGRFAAQPEQVTTGAGHDVDLDLSADGTRLAMATLRQNADLWRLPVSPDGSAAGPPEELVATTREDSRGAWSPDGSAIAFNSDRAGEMNIWIRNLADGTDRQVTRGEGGDFQPDWSPDASRLVFFSGRGGNIDIWDVHIATGALRRLTTEESSETHAFYSPDGSKIAYMSDRDGRLELWVMNADGSERRQITRGGISIHFLRWSAGGKEIYFQSLAGERPRVMRVSTGGGDPQPLAPVVGGAHISFSPDRSMIMDVVNHKALWVSPLLKGSPRKVFEFPDRDVRIDYPTWSPDGRWVLFDRLRPEGGDTWMLENFR